MAEKHVEAYAKRKIEALGGMCMKFVSPGRKGVPDRLIVSMSGLVYFLELKWGKNGTSAAQDKFYKDMQLRGITVYYAKTKQEIDEFIENIYL